MKKEFKFDPIKHTYTLDGKRMYGITTILNVISKPKLIGWAARMAVEFLKKHFDLTGRALNEWSFKEWKDILERAKNAHRKKKEKAGEKGTDVHAEIEEIIKSTIADKDKGLTGATTKGGKQIENFLDWAINNKVKFLESEKQLYHEDLFIAGTVDFIFEKEGKTYIGDVKTFAKMWDRTPMLQCAGYGLMYESMYDKKIDGYCIVRLGKDGSFSEHWGMDVSGDTKGFLAAVELFKQLKTWEINNNNKKSLII